MSTLGKLKRRVCVGRKGGRKEGRMEGWKEECVVVVWCGVAHGIREKD